MAGSSAGLESSAYGTHSMRRTNTAQTYKETGNLVAIIGARLLVRFAERASERGFAIAPDLTTRFPTLEQRANRYLPVLTGLVRGIVYLVALLVVLQAWDIGSFAWFATELGRKATGIALSIAAG